MQQGSLQRKRRQPEQQLPQELTNYGISNRLPNRRFSATRRTATIRHVTHADLSKKVAQLCLWSAKFRLLISSAFES